VPRKSKLKDTQPAGACQKFFQPEGHLSKVLPRYEFRPAQLKMAQAVEDALRCKAPLLVEAATGTGKTWAYLIPAILSQKKVIISTGTKTLQDQLFYKDLPLLAKALPQPFNYSMMKGKSNYLCLQRFGQAFRQSSLSGIDTGAAGEYSRDGIEYETLRAWAEQTRSGDRAEIAGLSESAPAWQEVSIKSEACLGGQCPDYDRCYLTRTRQAAAAADIVVVNHHLFFADLALKQGGYGEILPHYQALVFDEAHLLEEVATQYFGTSFSSYRLEDFVRDAEREFGFNPVKAPACLEQCRQTLMCSKRFFEPFRLGQDRYRLTARHFSKAVLDAGSELFTALKQLDRSIVVLQLKSDAVAHLSERIETLLGDLQIFLDDKRDAAQSIYWVEQGRGGVFLHSSPLDVSTILSERLFKWEIPTIMTSATLSTQGRFDYIQERLGIDRVDKVNHDGRTRALILDRVFQYEKQALIYLPRHLPAPSDEDFCDAISEEIVRILGESRGRAFLLFTSWRNLEAVYRQVAARLPYPLLKQGEGPKQALIDAFRKDISSVLFGTTSFWQGVDVEGEALSCVIIDKLPFASPTDPLTAARIDALALKGKDPFSSFQIPVAILSLRQGIGRLIRNSQDRGLIAILDRRITTKSYGKQFLESLPPAPRTHDFKAVAAFFKSD